jgi:AAA family ATP:ADP antiporter
MKTLSEIWNKSHILASLIVALSSSCLLAGYEFVRSASFSLFKAAYGVENLPVVIALTPLGVFSALWVYAKILTAFGPRKTLAYTTLGSAALICLCYVLIKMEVKFANALLFVLRDCYAVLLVEQFWSFINSILKESDAKRFNGLILTISTIGAIAGGLLVHQFAVQWGTEQMVLIGGLLCIPCWYIAQLGYKLSGYEGVESKKVSSERHSDLLGFRLFMQNRVLFIIAGMILLSQFYSYFIGLNFQQVIQGAYPNVDEQTAFSGLFFAITNAASIVAQFIVTPLVLARFSIATIHLCIPIINFISMVGLFLFPGLAAASYAYLIYKVMEYSIFRAAKEILYIPLSFDVRFRAKEVIDVLGHRSAQGIVSTVYGILAKLSLLRSVHIPYLTTGIVVLWFLVILPLRNRQESKERT